MLNERIKALREDNDLTQAELGKIINTNQRTVSQYELGTRQIPSDVIIKLARYFNVSTDYLFGLTKDPTPAEKRSTGDKKISIKNNRNTNVGNINM